MGVGGICVGIKREQRKVCIVGQFERREGASLNVGALGFNIGGWCIIIHK